MGGPASVGQLASQGEVSGVDPRWTRIAAGSRGFTVGLHGWLGLSYGLGGQFAYLTIDRWIEHCCSEEGVAADAMQLTGAWPWVDCERLSQNMVLGTRALLQSTG